MNENGINKNYKDFIDLIETLEDEDRTKRIEHGHDEVYISHDGILTFKNVDFINIKISNRNICFPPHKRNSNVDPFYFKLTEKYIDIENILDNSFNKNINFIDCIFDRIEFSDSIIYNYNFNKCNFKVIEFNKITKKINIEQSSQNQSIYYKSNIEFLKGSIDNIVINECEFDGKFYVNNQKNGEHKIYIEKVSIKESTFNENFKIQNSEINKIEISNIDFEKNVDFFKSTFKMGYKSDTNTENNEIAFNGLNIKGITIFEDCIFENKLTIAYTTFTGLVQFRSARFNKGLNIDKTNTDKEINFYNVKGLEKNSESNKTSQETYRILKHNCQRIGNIIDANHYHALELEKRKEYLDSRQKDNYRERIVFYINWKTSRFGTDWRYAIFSIVILGFLTLISLHYEKIGYVYNSTDLINWKYFGIGINKAFGYMSILNKSDALTNNSFVFLINKSLLGYLYYQFVTAVRNNTRK